MNPEVGWGEKAGYSVHTANVVHHKTLIVDILLFLTSYCIKIKKLKHKNKKESNNNKRYVKKKRENVFIFTYIYICMHISVLCITPSHSWMIVLKCPIKDDQVCYRKGNSIWIQHEYNLYNL